jgi:hypothetical protein
MGNETTLVRTSERSAFKRCRWAWNLSFEERLRQRRDAPVLRFGTLVHEALAMYYVKGKKRGLHPAKAFRKVYDADIKVAGEFAVFAETGDILEGEEWVDARQLGIDLLEMYVERYRGDRGWEVIATEQPFQVPVLNPRTGRYMFTYTGILDLIMKEISTKRIWIWDHKTCRAFTDVLYAMPMNDQFGSYWTFGSDWLRTEGILRQSQFKDLSGLLVNLLRRAKRDDRLQNADGHYLNKDGSVSKRQPSEIFHREPTYRSEHDKEEVRRRAMNDYREMQMVRRGELPSNKSPSMWHCKGCAWLDVCELHETGNDWKPMLSATTEAWDPYSQHEIEFDEKR